MQLRPTFLPPPRNISYEDTVRMRLTSGRSAGSTSPTSKIDSRRQLMEQSIPTQENITLLQQNKMQSLPDEVAEVATPSTHGDYGAISLFGGELVVDHRGRPPQQTSLAGDNNSIGALEPSQESESRTAPPRQWGQGSLEGLAVLATKRLRDGSHVASRPADRGGLTASQHESSSAGSQRPKLSSASSPHSSSPLSAPLSPWHGLELICRNIAASESALAAFRRLFACCSGCSLATLFSDRSSSLTPTSVKLCTPSAACGRWQCSCDRHSRAGLLLAPGLLLGVLVLLDLPGSPHAAAAYLLPLNDQLLPGGVGVDFASRAALLREVLLDADKPKCVFHAQLALLPLLHLLPDLRPPLPGLADPRIAAYLLNSDCAESDLELHKLLATYPGATPAGGGTDTFLSSDEAGLAGGKLGSLAKFLLGVHKELRRATALQGWLAGRLRAGRLWELFRGLEMPLTSVLADMEAAGVGLDAEELARCQASVTAALAAVASQVAAALPRGGGAGVNLSSPEQVAELLYAELGLPAPAARTAGKTGRQQRHLSTSEEELQRIRHLHPVVDLVLQHRALSKLLTTYLAGLAQYTIRLGGPGQAQRETVHCLFNQTVVRTGRLSCCRPNLQSLPNAQRVAGLELNVRRAVCAASAGCLLVSGDYSQVEMRVLAHVAGDADLARVFAAGGDVYRRLASDIFGSAPGRVSDEERARAKVVCLGVLYGMGPAAAAAKLDMSAAQAGQIMARFYGRFPRVKAWAEAVKAAARETGHVQTICGRRRHLFAAGAGVAGGDGAGSGERDRDRDRDRDRSQPERQAVNTVIQGSASDIIKLAMLHTSAQLAADPALTGCRLLLQVHDELVFECPAQPAHTLAALKACMRACMERSVAAELGIVHIPLTVTISEGATFGDLLSSTT